MFGRKERPDIEILRRIDRLAGALEQATRDLASLPPSSQEPIAQELQALKGLLASGSDTSLSIDARIGFVQRVEAEMCLYVSKEVLAAERIRVEDRLYRLSEFARGAWKSLLERCSDSRIHTEVEHRRILSRLNYELAEAAESYTRRVEKRAKDLALVLWFVCALVILQVSAFVWQFAGVLRALHTSPSQIDYVRVLPVPLIVTVLLAGCLGATVAYVRSIPTEEKDSLPHFGVLIGNVFVRVSLGSIYALVVVLALVSDVLPVKPSTERGIVFFLIVAGVAAGISDQLFGQAVSSVITGKRVEKSKSSAKAK